MTYYKIKPEYDNRQVYIKHNHYYEYSGIILVANELYTVKEWERLNKRYYIRDSKYVYDIIECNKNKTYWFFGARFEM